MARLARVVVPGLPHHVMARGNRREPIFFQSGGQGIYRDLLAEQVRKAEGEVFSLMAQGVYRGGEFVCSSVVHAVFQA